MTANTIAPADLDILRAIAAGDRVHHMRRRRLTNMGLVTSAGDLTKLGAEAIAPAQAPASKPSRKRTTGARCEDCTVLLTSRTRSDHATLCSYCLGAAEAENSHADGYADHHPEGCRECGTYDAGAHWDQPAKSKAAKKSVDLNRCACSPDCESVSRNLFAPGHDARAAGIAGRRIAADVGVGDASDEDLERMVADELPDAASDKLVAKAARVARNAIVKARAKQAKRKAA